MKIIKYIPNALTIMRIILLIPIMLLLMHPGWGRIFSLILFVIGVVSDWLDGVIARKYHAQSKLGQFLDPLADKIVILSVFVFFTYVDPFVFPYWLVWLVGVREFTVTMIRIDGVSQKKDVQTLMAGKIKTVVQFVTIFILYILFIIKDQVALHSSRFLMYLEHNILGSIPLWNHIFGKQGTNLIIYLPTIALSIVTIFSLYSGILYVLKNKSFFLD